MNRREFLKSLVAMGASVALPAAAMDTAPDAVVEEAWADLEASPIVFRVTNDSGTLEWEGIDEPTCRRDCLSITLGPAPTVRDVKYSMLEDWRAKKLVARAYLDAEERYDDEPEEVDDDEIVAWLGRSKGNLASAADRLNAWLDETNLDEFDYEAASLGGVTAQGAALRFWRDGDFDRDAFGVIVVEGDCPGSSYYAAELEWTIDDANAAARALGVPIRFA